MPSISLAMVGERADEAVRCFNSRYEVLLEPDAYRLNRQACVLLSSEENEHRTNERTRSRTDRLTNRRLERASEHDCSRNERTNERTKKRLNRAGIRRILEKCTGAPRSTGGKEPPFESCGIYHLRPSRLTSSRTYHPTSGRTRLIDTRTNNRTERKRPTRVGIRPLLTLCNPQTRMNERTG